MALMRHAVTPPDRSLRSRARVCRLITSLTLVVPCVARAQTADATDAAPADDNRRRVRVVFDDRPALEIGESVRVELGIRVDGTIRGDGERDGVDRTDWSGRRIELEGRVTDRVAFEVSHEIGDDRPWRDVFAEVTATKAVAIRGGRFKVPFSDERLRSVGDIDFVHRSYVADRLAPGRQNGAMVHGEVGRNLVTIAGGLFRSGAPDGLDEDPVLRDLTRGTLGAGRVTVRPFSRRPNRSHLRSMRVGVAAYRDSTMPGLTSLGAETLDGDTAIFPPVYVEGPRHGLGTELRWSPSRLRINAEWIQVHSARRGQAIDGGDLPALVARGWHASVMYRVARWNSPDAGRFAKWFLREIEVGGRLQSIAFGTGEGQVDFVHPRADLVPWHTLRALTLGVTWRLNTFSRVQINAISEEPDVPAAAGIDDRRRWSSVVKLQVQL